MRAPALLLPLLACASWEEGPGDQAQPGAVTWSRDIQPLLARHCAACHGEEDSVNLLDYATAAALGHDLVVAVESGRMPPFGAAPTASCAADLPWKDDPRLNPEERALLQAWVNGGAPAGDDRPPAAPPEVKVREADIALTPAASVVVEPGPDVYTCFVLEPSLRDRADRINLAAVTIQPGNPDIVHHALLFTDPQGRRAAEAGVSSFPCFGAAPTEGQLLGLWAPGMGSVEAPPTTHFEIANTDGFILQVHYHPRVDGPATDLTTVGLTEANYVDGPAAVQLLVGNLERLEAGTGTGLLPGEEGDSEFRIPAGAPDHVEQMVLTVPATVPLFSIGAHMHLAGHSMEVLRLGESGADCLLSVPDWDFGAQRVYQIDHTIAALPQLTAGDQLLLRCTYDNTGNNRALAAELDRQGIAAPFDMVLGEGSLDEMCLAELGVLVPEGSVAALLAGQAP